MTASFIDGELPHDGHGHGTHCIGTACGPMRVQGVPRYGIASEAEIYAGKVLSNAGSGADGGIIAGLQWALTQGCQVVSMSLGSPPNPQGYSRVYENLARRALRAGMLIVAAAGNESQREAGYVAPCGSPANCPSILAVAAVGPDLALAPFSSDGLEPNELAGPGVNVVSTFPMPQRYRSLSGTSMATPHVAGISALLAQQTGARGAALWQALVQRARRLATPGSDVGAGLVQA